MKLKYFIYALLALLLPGIASAANINPAGGNSWDLYVFGNGRAVYEILMGVRMLMNPDAGNSGFTILLLFMATLGFLVLAVAAGFDPGKNLMKMFGYIFVVWMVTLFTTKITANVTVIDMVANGDGVHEEYVVERVPSLVALPAALTSQVGHYFTKVIETYFTTPDSFKMTGNGAGQFNLFAKMVEESNEYGFSYPELKQSLSAYTADCIVPAMAMNRLEGKDGQGNTVRGMQALLNSTNLMDTYGSAVHKAIMTTYYPITSDAALAAGAAPAAAGTLGGMGELMSCEEAYKALKKDMEVNAKSMLDSGSAAWKKSGIAVPFETAFRDMLQGAAGAGSTAAGFSSPSGYILQQGFLNSMSGSFRTAALQTGNNELIQAAALSQAEAQQKSAWVAAFAIFNNMMGYVFTTLQAFIFAITPMIVVALMVPGLGKGIFTNYAQILIWLTLWMPMLALINFLITLFATDSAVDILGFDQGVTALNKGLFVEKNKNLVIAAQFLGTMTPMITWGIVKGAMAFTEFISHGVGSAFASSAGAAAATGNLSLNNMSMDNLSANKYNNAFSSTVGMQATNAFSGAGQMLSSQGGGGAVTSLNGGNVDAKKSLQDSQTSAMQMSQSVKEAFQHMKQEGYSLQQAISHYKGQENSKANQEVLAMLQQHQAQVSANEAKGTSAGLTNGANGAASVGDKQAAGTSSETAAKAQLGGTLFGVGVTGSEGGAVTGSQGRDSSQTNALTNGASTSVKADATQAVSDANSNAESHLRQTSAGSSSNDGTRVSNDKSASFQDFVSNSIAKETAFQNSLTHSQSVSTNFGMNSEMTMQEANNLESRIHDIRMNSTSAADVSSRMAAMGSAYDTGAAASAAGRSGVISQANAGPGGGSAPLVTQADVAPATAPLAPKAEAVRSGAAQINRDAAGKIEGQKQVVANGTLSKSAFKNKLTEVPLGKDVSKVMGK